MSLHFLLRPALRWAVGSCYPNTPDTLPILMYHRVLPEPDELHPEVPDVRRLTAQFKTLSEYFNVLPLQEAQIHLQQGTLPPRSIALTFDDGYRDNFEVAAPVLKAFGFPATIFVASGFLDGGLMFNDIVIESVRRMSTGTYDFSRFGVEQCDVGDIPSRSRLIHSLILAIKYLDPTERHLLCETLVHQVDSPLPDNLMMTREQVRQLPGMGITVGGHTVHHPILATLTPEAARHEILVNRDELANIVGTPPTEFAYPNGKPNRDYTSGHVEMIKQAGYSVAVSTAVAVATTEAPCFELPRFVLRETSPMGVVGRMCRMTSFRVPAVAL